MLLETPLASAHKNMGGKMVDFGGWNMPLHYGSQVEEHRSVRNQVGMFDVSHMTIVDLAGPLCSDFLRILLANDVAKLSIAGKALYSAMLNEQGGVIDDLVVYRMDPGYRLVVNCATREKDLQWIQTQAQAFDVSITERDDLAMIAVQGPQAESVVSKLVDADKLQHLAVFQGTAIDVLGKPGFIARTGYTGEHGYELIVDNDRAESVWLSLHQQGVAPCGLGARDTLRLEAGMNLYGHEMDEQTSPLVANMAWTIAWQPDQRRFIGRDALERERQAGVQQKLVGLVLQQKGVLRAGQVVSVDGESQPGVVTSGSFSPTLGYSIGLARVPVSAAATATVSIRNKSLPVDIVKPCFIRNGKQVFQ